MVNFCLVYTAIGSFINNFNLSGRMKGIKSNSTGSHKRFLMSLEALCRGLLDSFLIE